MYPKPKLQMTIDDFILPFSGKLSTENRWVHNVAKPARMALGSLIIQAKCVYTDRETVQQITENPYLQYFIGLKEYQLTKPFTPVAMVKFRKRFNAKRLAQINERILLAEAEQEAGKKAIVEKPQDDNKDDNNENGAGTTKEKESASETAECVIAMQFLVINLERKLRILFTQILVSKP